MNKYVLLIKQFRFEIACILPMVMYLLMFTFMPVLRLFKTTFTDAQTGQWTFYNLKVLFSQEDFFTALVNTLIIALGSLTLEIGLGLIMALILSARGRWTAVLKPIFMLPIGVPTVVVAVMMTYMFSSSGWINRILMDMGIIHQRILWLNGDYKSLLAIVAADSWKVTPLVMLILLAGIKSIDSQLYQAARIDGAKTGYIFRRVTLPLLMPSITTAVIIRGIDAFRIFCLALILTGENIKVLGTYSYLEFVEYHNPYFSAASALVLFVLIMSSVIIYLRAVGNRGLQAS